MMMAARAANFFPFPLLCARPREEEEEEEATNLRNARAARAPYNLFRSRRRRSALDIIVNSEERETYMYKRIQHEKREKRTGESIYTMRQAEKETKAF